MSTLLNIIVVIVLLGIALVVIRQLDRSHRRAIEAGGPRGPWAYQSEPFRPFTR